MNILKNINENESVSNEISDIMFSADNKKERSRRLEALRDNCNSELVRSHIEYYIDLLRKERRETAQRIVLALFSLLYFAFTLCRVWWYYHPDSNPFPQTNYTVSDLIQVIYLLLIAGAVLWGISIWARLFVWEEKKQLQAARLWYSKENRIFRKDKNE